MTSAEPPAAAVPAFPPVPPGRRLALPGRGTTFVREAGPATATGPALVLLHGWTVTSDLNWYGIYGPLARRFRLVAVDLRGHGRGLRSDEAFTLERCADDVLATVDELGLGRVVPVGYSMGGLVAQLVWRRGRDRVAGLVLGATARHFTGTVGDRVYFGGLAALVRAYGWAPPAMREQAVNRYLTARTGRLEPWAAAEVASGDMRAYLEAGRSIGTFSSEGWAGEIDVPTAVVVTERDRTVPTWRQRELAAAVPGARTFTVDGDHQVVARQPDRFLPALMEACEWVRDATAQLATPERRRGECPPGPGPTAGPQPNRPSEPS